MKKICIISVYFGKWPSWFDYYLKSCEFNPSVNWLIYTDCKIPKNASKNVRFINGSLEDFNKLASEKIKIKINIKNPYKLCDFKPAYGLIFEDYLKDFDFWGHADIDVIYGNIRKFITDEILKEYDIITAEKDLLVGHFTLFRNNKKMKKLFEKLSYYKEVFQSKDHYAFDEDPFRIKNKSIELRGMDGLIKDLTNKKYIKSYYRKMFRDMANFSELGFHNGNLIDINNGEFLYIHFDRVKHSEIFFVSKFKKSRNTFYIAYGEISYRRKLFRVFLEKMDRNIGKGGIFIKKHSPRLYYYLKKLIKNQ